MVLLVRKTYNVILRLGKMEVITRGRERLTKGLCCWVNTHNQYNYVVARTSREMNDYSADETHINNLAMDGC